MLYKCVVRTSLQECSVILGSKNKRASLYCLQDSEEKLFFISQEIASCETKSLRQGAHCPVDNGFTPTETAQLAENKMYPPGIPGCYAAKQRKYPSGIPGCCTAK